MQSAHGARSAGIAAAASGPCSPPPGSRRSRIRSARGTTSKRSRRDRCATPVARRARNSSRNRFERGGSPSDLEPHALAIVAHEPAEPERRREPIHRRRPEPDPLYDASHPNSAPERPPSPCESSTERSRDPSTRRAKTSLSRDSFLAQRRVRCLPRAHTPTCECPDVHVQQIALGCRVREVTA